MSVLLHTALQGEVTRLETLLTSATVPEDVELLRCAIADIVTVTAQIRARLNDDWALHHPRLAKT